MERCEWKFLRLRQSSFPTVRIAQLSFLINQAQNWFSFILNATNVHQIKQFFKCKIESGYWLDHYLFESESKPKSKSKSLGDFQLNNIIINAVVPFLFVYGKTKKIELYKDRAITFLTQLKTEKNRVVDKFIELGLKSENVATSQALLQLKFNCCDHKKCLNCNIGNYLLKNEQIL